MIPTCFDGLDEIYQHTKFGEIKLRAPAVGTEIGVFCVTLGLHARAGRVFTNPLQLQSGKSHA